MELRPAERADVRPLATLWTQAFPDARTVGDRMRQIEAGLPFGGIESAWVAEDEGRILGAFRAYRFEEHIGGAVLPMLGLAAVATSPTARRRGVGRALCRHAMRVGRERGDIVSVLYPFRPDFYRTLGWGLVGEMHAHRFAPAALPLHDEAAAVRPADPDDRNAIASCYARVAERSNGPIVRDARAWSHRLDVPGTYPFVFDDGGVRGYAIVRFGRGIRPGDGKLHVLELVAEDEEARRGLFGWLASQRDQFGEIRYDALPTERLDLILSDPRPPRFRPARSLWYPTARRIRGPMLRVLDVPAALEARPHWGDVLGIGLTLEIEVLDDDIPGNRGPWALSVEEHGARVHSGPASGWDARLVVDAATFAQLYAGELSPSTAVRLGLARAEGAVAALDRIFHLREPFWLLDEF